jgi:hypothetical protein
VGLHRRQQDHWLDDGLRRDGHTFMRFYRLNKVDASDVSGTTFTGTYWLNAAAGAVTRVERCDVATKDQVQTGQYQVNASVLTFLFTDHSEQWTKQ